MLSPVGSNQSGTISGYPTPMNTHIGMAGGLPQINTAPYGTPMNPAHMAQPQQSPLQNRMPDLAQSPYNPSPSTNRMMSPVSYHTAPNSAYGTGPMGSRANSHDAFPGQVNSRGQEPLITRSATSSGFDSGNQYVNNVEHGLRRPMTADPRTTRPNSFPSGNMSGWNASPTSTYSAPPSQGMSNGYSGPNGNSVDTRGPSSYPSNLGAPPQMSLPLPLTSTPTPVNSQLPQSQVSHVPSNQFQYSSEAMDTKLSMNGPTNNPDPDNMPSSMEYIPNNGFRSPYFMSDDFLGFLINEGDANNGMMAPGPDPLLDMANPMPRGFIGMEDEPTNNSILETMPTPDPMAVNAILDRQQNQTLSEVKWEELLEFIMERFNETNHDIIRKQKEALLQGDRSNDSHPISLRMMQTYIGSYWYHFHPQMPILHRPTFSADKTKTLLLIAVIAIGASCLDKDWGPKVTEEGADLSNFLAWHLRGEVFQDKDFRSPAQLWVFQALLLLEVHEKMYSTRALHERAHIHHGTTLTLMRRGSSLIGRSALDSPPLIKGEDARNGQAHGSNMNVVRDPDQWWNHWIINEGTRRTAFAAFIIDSLHATMFGHSATMVAHEMKLQLPCDESLWSATSSVEVGKIEAELAQNGVRPINFCDGLKSTLNCESVRTNAFGRTALMAGALNVSWHMNQRDTQVRSLGDSKAFQGRLKWRGNLTRAYDFWREDFDTSMNEASSSSQPSSRGHPTNNNTTTLFQFPNRRSNLDEDNIFESKTVLHHLAHMAMHMDIVSCQIFAKAERLLGRTTLPSDKSNAEKRIRTLWAPRASARDATFYSLKFLKEVLIPKHCDPHSGRLIPVLDESAVYSARDDYLLNRPWVLYYAALIVWSYGYAHHGAIEPAHIPQLNTYRDKALDMYAYLERVGGIRGPEVLEGMPGLNRCLGMLWILKDMFDRCRWELLHEAARLLKNCIDMLTGEAGSVGEQAMAEKKG